MDDYRDDDKLGPARGIMNALAMSAVLFAAVAFLASCVVGWS